MNETETKRMNNAYRCEPANAKLVAFAGHEIV